MKYIHLRAEDCLPAEYVDTLAGRTPQPDWFTTVIKDEDTTVYKPDGSLLCVVRKNVLPVAVITPAYKILRKVRDKGTNRKTSTQGYREYLENGGSIMRIKVDGTVSKAVAVPDHMAGMSNIIGYFDRSQRFPYCRQTRFNTEHPEKFGAALPMLQAVGKVFKETVPDRYNVQMDYVRRTSKDFLIHKTPFTTITVNLNYPTALHKDVGDLKEGFSCLTVIRAGDYRGSVLGFPQFKVGADLHTGDVIMMDAHEWHANTPIEGVPGTYERLTLVLYYREKMIYCGTAEQEIEFAKNRKQGDMVTRVSLSSGETTTNSKGE